MSTAAETGHNRSGETMNGDKAKLAHIARHPNSPMIVVVTENGARGLMLSEHEGLSYTPQPTRSVPDRAAEPVNDIETPTVGNY